MLANALLHLATFGAKENIGPLPVVIFHGKSSKSFLPSPGKPCPVSKSPQHNKAKTYMVFKHFTHFFSGISGTVLGLLEGRHMLKRP
ncbi:hypothetical protein ACTRXD_05940 [Nitrospira sp. T9]|uniref:hypothetical protein n=1 Tax=Nitrospira sp. T9 TaxID=3456077 RepID=UPI003F9A751A